MANYPEFQVAPMREELIQAGFTQLMTPQEVDQALVQPGTTLLVVNSVCGCAAAGARPGVIQALRARSLRFDHLVTVFAGMETEATQQARTYFEGAAPSSPQAAIFRDGRLVHLMGRNAFLERSPEAIAQELIAAAELAGIPA
jgi:putative YphP/YqiW family bacilliredoxin